MSEININVDGNASVGGDIVGGDKITGNIVNITNTVQQIHTKEKLIPRMAPPLPRVFTGRDDLVMDLLDELKLERDNSRAERPVSLILKGMGGVGKTAVATVLAHDPVLTKSLPDGVLWANFGPDPDLMTWLATWGDQLGLDVSNYTDVEARARALGTFLHDRQLLIVLDDVWRESDAKHFWIASPGSRIVVTTRDVSVAASLVDSGQKSFSIDPLSNRAGLRLLREFAPEAVTADPEGAEKLVDTLGGLPLGLALAGQMIAREWQAGLGVSGALEELMGSGERLDLLEDDQAQVSLRAMLAVGYDHLPDDEARKAFRQLGVFGGQPRTFTWMAAADIWELPRRPAQKHITTLVDQQMIQPLGDGVYSLHNSFADFALSLLTESGEKTAVYDRFVDHYLHLIIENVESDWQEVESHLSQIRHAFDWLIEESRLDIVAQFIQTMNRFLTRRGLWQILTEWTEMALQLAESVDQQTIAAQLNNNLAYIYYQNNDWKRALSYYDHGLEIFEKIGDLMQTAVTLSNMAAIYVDVELYDDALDRYEQSQEIFEQGKDWPRLAATLNGIGGVYRRLDELETAVTYHELSQKLYKGLEDEAGLARTLNQLGAVYDLLGDTKEALSCYEEAHAIFVKNGNLIHESVSLYNIAMLCRDAGELDKAIRSMERVVEIDEKLARHDLNSDRALLEELRVEKSKQG